MVNEGKIIYYFVIEFEASLESMLAIFNNSCYKVNTEFDGYAYDITFDLTKQEQ
ncbi:MAG: hypothetical protein ACYS6K_04920 [Planctomycetota bacterium]